MRSYEQSPSPLRTKSCLRLLPLRGGALRPSDLCSPASLNSRQLFSSSRLDSEAQPALIAGRGALVLHQRQRRLSFDVFCSLFLSTCSESHFGWCRWRWSTGSRSDSRDLSVDGLEAANSQKTAGKKSAFPAARRRSVPGADRRLCWGGASFS